MIEWRHFLRRVVMHLPGCPEPFVVDALRDAATDFCTRTRIWKVKHVMLATTVAGQTNYAIASGAAEGEVTHLHAAWVGETEVPINTPGEDDDTAPGKSEASFKLRLVDGTSVQLTPAPSVAGQVIKGTVSYRPFSDAPGAPDEVGRRHGVLLHCPSFSSKKMIS